MSHHQWIEKMFEDNLGLMKYVANRVYAIYPQVDREELESVLREYLYISICHYNSDRGKFSTYATRVMLNAGRGWAKRECEYLSREILPLQNWDSPTHPEYFPSSEKEELLSAIESLQAKIELASTQIRTKKQREIVQTFLDNPTLKYKEIADKVNVSHSYVKTTVRKFKARVRASPNLDV